MNQKSESSYARWNTPPDISVRDGVPRILLVDDDEAGGRALVECLLQESLECRTASRGADAIALSVIWQPHIVILDISMPILNGFEIARAIRDGDTTKHIAIIALTALTEQEVFKHARGDEFNGYCQKGQSPTALLALIKSVTG